MTNLTLFQTGMNDVNVYRNNRYHLFITANIILKTKPQPIEFS